jgi:hypothetical protein
MVRSALALQGRAGPILGNLGQTLFAWHKLPLRTYLMVIAVFCNEEGKSMLRSAVTSMCVTRRVRAGAQAG